VKKFIVTLLMGAFLFVSLAAVSGCSETKVEVKDKDKKEEKKP
jgi:hypothetical protein